MEILTSVKRLYISFKSLVNDFVYSCGRAALLLLVEVQNHTVPVRERGRIRVNTNEKSVSNSIIILFAPLHLSGIRGVAVGYGTALQAGRSRIRFSMVSWGRHSL